MKSFLYLSRVPHVLLDIATPAFCTLLWLGKFPSYNLTLISLITAFAAYTCVYALNDLFGYKIDKIKFTISSTKGYRVESTKFRHPIAQGMLNFWHGLCWIAMWGIIAIYGAYYLNPIIVMILFIGVIAESIYCLILRVSYLRIIFSGIVKSCGPIAAIFVVDHHPDPTKIGLIFLWVFLWEIGGQNIPADWNDIEEDRLVSAKTIPIYFGTYKTGVLVLLANILTVIISCFLPLISPIKLGIFYNIISLLTGYSLLLVPAYHLYHRRQPAYASRLFECASYYPLALLIFMVIKLL